MSNERNGVQRSKSFQAHAVRPSVALTRALAMAGVCAAALSAAAGGLAQERPGRNPWLRREYAAPRNDEVIRASFRDAVTDVRHSVVRVLNDRRALSLGVIVDPAGLVLTKNSQLEGKLECNLADNRRVDAHRIAFDDDFDVALLKLEAIEKPLPVIKWQTHPTTKLGGWLATPGLGELPIAVGIVSAETRRIPAGRGVLGILLAPHERGAAVGEVMPGSGAADAGLKASDVIVRVNGSEIRSPESLQDVVRKYRPGDRIELALLRGEEQLSVKTVLRTLTQIQSRGESDISVDGPVSERSTGFPLVMQHDTVLEPADCGGVLVNLDGEAVGLNIARADRVSTFAIPASALPSLVERLKAEALAAKEPRP